MPFICSPRRRAPRSFSQSRRLPAFMGPSEKGGLKRALPRTKQRRRRLTVEYAHSLLEIQSWKSIKLHRLRRKSPACWWAGTAEVTGLCATVPVGMAGSLPAWPPRSDMRACKPSAATQQSSWSPAVSNSTRRDLAHHQIFSINATRLLPTVAFLALQKIRKPFEAAVAVFRFERLDWCFKIIVRAHLQ